MGTNRDGLVGLMTMDCFKKITDGPDAESAYFWRSIIAIDTRTSYG
jgi:hypothetical protein